PVAIDPAFREKITGDAQEKAYDVSKYKKPENPEIAELGGVKLAKNKEEYLLMELLPAVANRFLRNRRNEEYAGEMARQAEQKAAEEAAKPKQEPITGPVLKAPMGGTVIEVKVKPGDAVKKNSPLLVYEAMKMENDVLAEFDGTVKRVFVVPGDVVATDQVMVEFE
ncbi:MAG: carboxylase, partial [Paramuribaculum sp.]|nr:carboxylase [Paramuribaculum sp.]